MQNKITERETRQKSYDKGWQKPKRFWRERKQTPTQDASMGGTWSKRMPARYKLVLRAADDGSMDSISLFHREITAQRQNRLLLSQISTVGNMRFEYKDRTLLSHNHRGGVLFSVENPQEAARLMNLGIFLNGRKHRVIQFEKAKASDLCTHCSAWGHLERSCRFGGTGRCGICSGNHRTEGHLSVSRRSGSHKPKCPNCGGNHEVRSDDCLSRCLAEEKENSKQCPSGSSKEMHKRNPVKRGANHVNRRIRHHV